MGFAHKEATTDALHAELLALMIGLDLSFTKNLFPTVVETNSQVLCNLFKEEQLLYPHLLHDCSFLLDAIGVAEMTHVYREGNTVADTLAKYGSIRQHISTEEDNIMYLETPPAFILPFFIKDKLG